LNNFEFQFWVGFLFSYRCVWQTIINVYIMMKPMPTSIVS